MKRRIHLKKTRKKRKKGTILLVTLIGLILIILCTIQWIGTKINPILIQYAEIESKRFVTLILNDGVTKQVTEELEKGDLFVITKNKNEEIQVVDFDPIMTNKVLKAAITGAQKQLKAAEEGDLETLDLPTSLKGTLSKLNKGVVCEIPLGLLTNNSLLANLGPKMPVKLSFLGDVTGNIKTDMKPYGINNALMEISVHIEVTQQIIMPLVSKEIPLSIDIPVAIRMVQGKVPTYYQNGLGQNSNLLTLPME